MGKRTRTYKCSRRQEEDPFGPKTKRKIKSNQKKNSKYPYILLVELLEQAIEKKEEFNTMPSKIISSVLDEKDEQLYKDCANALLYFSSQLPEWIADVPQAYSITSSWILSLNLNPNQLINFLYFAAFNKEFSGNWKINDFDILEPLEELTDWPYKLIKQL